MSFFPPNNPNGILSHLSNGVSFENYSSIVCVESTPTQSGWADPLRAFYPQSNQDWASTSTYSFPFVNVSFHQHQLLVSNYSFRSRIGSDVNMPKGWIVEGSFDGNNWMQIHKATVAIDDLSFGKTKMFECHTKGIWKHIRFTMMEQNHDNNWFFHIRKIEFFGHLCPISSQCPLIPIICSCFISYPFYSHMISMLLIPFIS